MAKSRPGRTASSGSAVPSRLPSTRERRPALAALAVLLIVGGALASGWLALRAGNRDSFLQVSNDVAQGSRITGDDLGTVSLPEDYSGGVRSTDKAAMVGRYATTKLLAGTVLTGRMLSDRSALPDNTVQVSIPTAAAGLSEAQNGARVGIYLTSTDAAAGTDGIVGQIVKVVQGDASIGSSGQVTALVNVDVSCGKMITTAAGADEVAVALVGATTDKAQPLRETCGA